MTDETISDEDFGRLRARLEARQDELTKALRALSSGGATEEPGGVVDCLFRMLGIVTFWLSLPLPPPTQAAAVHASFDVFMIETGPNALETLKGRVARMVRSC